MSLVVAHLVDDSVIVVSDTKIVFPDSRKTSMKSGTLKVVVINKAIAICFAGHVEHGLSAIRAFAEKIETSDLTSCLSALVKSTSVCAYTLEFIVVCTGISNTLHRVRSGNIESGSTSSWIGDHAAFEAFQFSFLKPWSGFRKSIMEDSSPAIQRSVKLCDAMDSVIADPLISSVGGFNVRIGLDNNGSLNYRGGIFIQAGRDFSVEPGEEILHRILQPVESGGYAVSIVEPKYPGTPALAVNFPLARMGYIFLPLIFDNAKLVENVSTQEFVSEIVEEYGVTMRQPPNYGHPE